MITLARIGATNLWPSRQAWLRFNRILAWSLIASPLIQLALHMRFGTGLLMDIGLLLAHGVLSLVLFGVPKRRGQGFSLPMHVFGFRPAELSPRNRFLLSGYRIALGMVPLLPPAGLFSLFFTLYATLRMPVTVLEHICGGANYALLRWRMASWLAEPIVCLYVILVITNLIFQA